MFKHGFFKRGAALLMSALILILQLGVPTLALAQDVSSLPTVYLYWQTADGEMSAAATASPYADTAIYWAYVPAEALQNGMTVEVLGNGDPALSYAPEAGTPIFGADATLVDGNPAAYVEVYRDGMLEGSYPLYVSSSLDVPPAQPTEPEKPNFDPVPIRVNYYDPDNTVVGGYDSTVPMEGKTFNPASALPEGYTLISTDSVFVEMYADGTLSHSEVAFYVQPIQPEEPNFDPVPIRVNYYDPDNTVVGGYDSTVPMEGKTFNPASALPEGYTLISTDSVFVEMYADGTLSHSEVAFYVQPIQPEEPNFDPVPIRVNYYDPDNTVVGGYDSTVPMEGKTFNPASALPEGYTLISTDSVFVEMYADGTLSHSEVAFYVQPIQPEEPNFDPVPIRVNYYDPDNTVVGGYDSTVPMEGKTFNPASALPEGYTLISTDSVFVEMYADGTLSHSEVAFYVQPIQPEEPNFDPVPIRVNYYDPDNTVVGGYDSTVPMEGKTFNPASALPEGYTLINTDSVFVEMYADGTLSHSEVAFYVQPIQPEGPVVLEQIDRYGRITGTVNLREGPDKNTAKVAANVKNLTMWCYELVQNEKGEAWYHVRYEEQGIDCYVSADYFAPMTQEESDAYANQGKTVDVPVRYVNGQTEETLYTETVSCEYGASVTVTARTELLTDFTLQGEASVAVAVDGQGNATPAEVVFTFMPKPQEAVKGALTVQYVTEEGVSVAETARHELEAGQYPAEAFAVATPDGYTFLNANADTVTVDENGAVTPETLVFVYQRLPQSATVRVSYFDSEENREVFAESVELAVGDHSIAPDAAKVPGYDLASEEAASVTVTPDGVASPATVVFNVVRHAASAAVTFEYVSTSGRAVADPLTATLSEKDSPVQTAEYAAAVEGYTLQSVSADTVTISKDGKADPARVTFTYEENATTARIEVHYRNSFGEDLPGSPVVIERGVGTHVITPEPSQVPSGYVLSSSATPVQVEVKNDLVAYPNSVSFTCYDANVRGTLTVNYYDSTTNQLIVSENRQLTPGSHTIAPDEALVAQKGKYELSDISPTTYAVEVNESAQVNPDTVAFYYKPVNVEVYQGFVITTRQTALRAKIEANSAVLQTLPVNTVLYVAGQYPSGSVIWHSAQVYTGAPAGDGFVNDADVRRISREEAEALKEENDQPAEPVQSPGYYITLYDGVPMRTYTNIYAEIRGSLKKNTVVYVSGQELDGSGNLWHQATYDKVSGYIKEGQIRKMTQAEVEQYLAQGGGQPTTPGGGSEYDPNGLSSYGYVSSGDVNFRQTPNGTKLKTLNRYAMALIIGTKQVNGVTWYNVNYNGTIGWLHGDYFHQMTLSEFTSFLGSPQYYQGITNNSVNAPTSKPSGGQSGGSGGRPGQGDVTSVEDWNVGSWQNTGVGPQTSYAPFNPYATPSATMAPLGEFKTQSEGVKFYQSADENAASVTLPKDAKLTVSKKITVENTEWYAATYNGRNGFVKADAAIEELAAAASPEPTATFVIGTMIPIDYEDETKETQTDTVPWGLIGAAIVLVGGAGGVYAYALNQNKRRKAAAARAAANRRAAAAGATAAAGSPYARRAVAAPPAAGNRNQQGAQSPQTRPSAPQQGYRNPYSNGSITGSAQPPVSQRPYGASYTTDASKVPYADGSLPTATPYAPPRQPQSSANAPQAQPPQQGANPYARPIQMTDTPPAAQGSEATRRRATRMQRYHDAEGGNEDNT